MTRIEKRKNFIINAIWLTLILGAFYLFIRYLFWILSPFIFAFLVAMMLQRPVNFLTQKIKMKRGIAAGICVTLLLAIFVLLFGLIGVKIVGELRGFINYFLIKLENIPQFLEQIEAWILNAIHFLPDSIERTVAQSIRGFLDNLQSSDVISDIGSDGMVANPNQTKFDFSIFFSPLTGVWNTAKQVPIVIVGIVISIIASFFMTADYKRITSFIRRQLSPERNEMLTSIKRITFSSISKMGKAYLIIIFVTFLEMCLGLGVLKLFGLYHGGYIFVIALITALVDIIPVLGTGTILVTWAVYCLIMGDIGLGIGLLVLYAVIFVIRQFLEPRLVANQLGLPAVVAIMSMYIGTQFFGVIGLFLMPIIVILLKILNDEGAIHIWKLPKDVEKKELEK